MVIFVKILKRFIYAVNLGKRMENQTSISNPIIKEIVEKIRKNKEVLAILLFGSYLRTPKYARDIDICVILEKDLPAKDMSKKRLKYLSHAPGKLDIQIFQLLPLYVRSKILKESKILYSKDTKKIYEKAYETIKDYNLFEKHYLDYIQAAA